MKTYSQEQVIDLLLKYASNSIPSWKLAEWMGKPEDKVMQTLIYFQQDWDSIEVGAEGPDAEQDKALDDLLDEYAQELINL